MFNERCSEKTTDGFSSKILFGCVTEAHGSDEPPKRRIEFRPPIVVEADRVGTRAVVWRV